VGTAAASQTSGQIESSQEIEPYVRVESGAAGSLITHLTSQLIYFTKMN
jgi:hypothetical protein